MEQISFFSEPAFPNSYEDIAALFEAYIHEGEKDDDLFTWSEIKGGRSYFMYGKKVMEFYPDAIKGPRLRLYILPKGEKAITLKADSSPASLSTALESLKQIKKELFRNTITDVFGCCNDFNQCSDAKCCLHQDDRFYNGCMYRSNLENGRIFYGKNRNV